VQAGSQGREGQSRELGSAGHRNQAGRQAGKQYREIGRQGRAGQAGGQGRAGRHGGSQTGTQAARHGLSGFEAGRQVTARNQAKQSRQKVRQEEHGRS
jgi:hypothetical protein